VLVLKGLLEDGEMRLADGRRLLRRSRWEAEVGSLSSSKSPHPDVVLVHPQFRLWALANRPGFPFQGNDFFRSVELPLSLSYCTAVPSRHGALSMQGVRRHLHVPCTSQSPSRCCESGGGRRDSGGTLSLQVIDNPDAGSEKALLRQYAPSMSDGLLTSLTAAFADLRRLNDEGVLSYPYSTRELVAVAKHAQVCCIAPFRCRLPPLNSPFLHCASPHSSPLHSTPLPFTSLHFTSLHFTPLCSTPKPSPPPTQVPSRRVHSLNVSQFCYC
jgi:hypothetical protein